LQISIHGPVTFTAPETVLAVLLSRGWASPFYLPIRSFAAIKCSYRATPAGERWRDRDQATPRFIPSRSRIWSARTPGSRDWSPTRPWSKPSWRRLSGETTEPWTAPPSGQPHHSEPACRRASCLSGTRPTQRRALVQREDETALTGTIIDLATE